MDLKNEQQIVCKQYNSPYFESPLFLKIGISANIKSAVCPINGLRHPMQGDTTGWYIWRGDYSSDPEFFAPLHLEHLQDLCPEVMKFLGLAPGWRFLVAPNHEDVWEDRSLLSIR